MSSAVPETLSLKTGYFAEQPNLGASRPAGYLLSATFAWYVLSDTALAHS